MIRLAGRTPARRRARTLVLTALLVIVDVELSHAQDTKAARRDGWIVGPLLGLPGVGSEYDLRFLTLGVGITRLVPNRPGLDLAIGTMPRIIIPERVLPLGVRIGPSIPLALGPDVFVIPSAGLSGIGGVGSGGAGGVAALYLGAAAVVVRGPVGFRAGLTVHGIRPSNFSIWLVEIGVMHVPLPRRTN